MVSFAETESIGNQVRRRALLFVIILILIVAPMVGRATLESRSALTRAREMVAAGERAAAVESYIESSRWDFPANPYSAAARRECIVILEDEQSPLSERLRGLELLASSLESSRHIFASFDRERVALSTLLRTRIESLRGENVYGVKLLSTPHVAFHFQVAAQVCFWAWIGLAVWICWRGFDSSARLRWGIIRRATPLLLVFYALWLLSLRLA